MKRTKLIAGNWKMNTTLAEAYTLARGVLHGIEPYVHTEVALCPPFTWLVPIAHDVIPHGHLPHLSLGAQDVSPEEGGAYTGDIAPAMLKGMAKYVIVGHSERVKFHNEMPAETGAKAKAALEAGLIPIVCVGELEESEDSAATVMHTFHAIAHALSKDELEKVIVAYEPVWAIGTGKAATPAYAEKVLRALRSVTTPHTRILYGGSVSDTNAEGFFSLPDCDGALVGGASLKLPSFLGIVAAAEAATVQRHAKD